MAYLGNAYLGGSFFGGWTLNSTAITAPIANGPVVVNEEPTSGNPVFCPWGGDLTTGVGGTNLQVHLVVGGTSMIQCNTSGAFISQNTPFHWGTSSPASACYFVHNSNQDVASGVLCVDTTSRNLIICDAGQHTFNRALSASSNPMLSIFANGQSTTNRIYAHHDATDGILGTGAGDLKLAPAGVVSFGTHTGIASETLSGYITIKDSGGTPRKIGVIS